MPQLRCPAWIVSLCTMPCATRCGRDAGKSSRGCNPYAARNDHSGPNAIAKIFARPLGRSMRRYPQLKMLPHMVALIAAVYLATVAVAMIRVRVIVPLWHAQSVESAQDLRADRNSGR